MMSDDQVNSSYPQHAEEEDLEDPPFVVRATVGMMSSSQKKPARKTEIIARQSMSTFVLKMLLCKQANVNRSDYDVRFKGRIVPTSSTGANVITLGECGITKETTSGVSLWENEACRRRKVADELDAIRRRNESSFTVRAHAREEARREIERIKAKNSYASESIGTDGGGTLERQDTSRYGYMPSSSSRAAAAAQRQPPAAENPYQQSQQHHQQYHHRVHHHQQHHAYPNANNINDHNHHDESPIVIDDTSAAAYRRAAAEMRAWPPTLLLNSTTSPNAAWPPTSFKKSSPTSMPSR